MYEITNDLDDEIQENLDILDIPCFRKFCVFYGSDNEDDIDDGKATIVIQCDLDWIDSYNDMTAEKKSTWDSIAYKCVLLSAKLLEDWTLDFDSPTSLILFVASAEDNVEDVKSPFDFNIMLGLNDGLPFNDFAYSDDIML